MHASAHRRSALLVTVTAIVLATAFTTAPRAQAAANHPCAMSERDQDPPGGTAAFNLTVTERGTPCATAKTVMRAFHRCRTDAGARCLHRVLRTWTCNGRRVAGGPRGLPTLYFGTFRCRSGARRVESGYQQLGPSCFGAASRDALRPCTNTSRALTPGLAEIEPFALDAGAAGCSPGVVAGACLFGTAPDVATRHVALVGDSHTYHWRAALALVAQNERWAGYSIDAGGCFFSARVDAFLPDCLSFYESTEAWFAAHPEVDTVFVTQNADTPVTTGPGETYLGVKVDGFTRAWQRLPATVKHIVVLRDTPASSQATFDCVAKVAAAGSQRPGPACALPRAVALRQDTAVITARRLNAPRYQVIDLTHLFCGSRSCYPVIAGARVNADIFGHLTTTYMRTVAPYLERAVRRLEAGW
jgi:hypothetical protein